MRRILLLALVVAATAFTGTGCEAPAATRTIELTIRQIGPQDQAGDVITAEVALVGGQCDTGPCLPNPCPNVADPDEPDIPAQTRCVGMGMQFQCYCPAGQHLVTDDETMEESCVPDEVCEPGTCSGHGACTEMEGQLSCECDEGYLGANCTRCDEDEGYYDDGFGGCATDVPVCRIDGADEVEAFLTEAEEALGRPPVEIALIRLDVDIDESSALVVRSWPAIFSSDATAYFRTYDGFPATAAQYDIWDDSENANFVDGSETLPPIEGEIVIGRQTLKADPDYLDGRFSVGLQGTTPLQVTQPYGFDAILTMEVEAY